MLRASHDPRTPARLRPGFPVLQRDPHTLQVGLRPPDAVRLPDTPAVRAMLEALASQQVLGDLDPDAARALATLTAAGLVVPCAPGPPVEESALALFGTAAATRVSARGRPIGLQADPATERDACQALADAGLIVDDDRAEVVLVVSCGPLRRTRTDGWIRRGVPHLVVSGWGRVRRLGPFVSPGQTACVRCVDAHESQTDPRLPLLIDQAAHPRTAAVAPVDPVLNRMALTWAVRDVARFLEGDEPSTWSTTVDIGPTEAPVITRWLRHPACGCAWDVV